MKIKSQRDFWSGLLFVIVGVAFAWGSISNYSFGTSARPGPGYFPFGLGVLLAILGGTVLFKALTIESEGGQPIGPVAWRPLLIVVGAIALFGVALPRLGMAITLPLLIITASFASDEFRWRDAILSSVILTIGSWAIFVWGLNLVIPVWPPFLGL
ncbi:tripartite tricarboxylate transporter TctB family protein [Roseateles amylovorans]|jgi:Tripartite tricarboxylate transporter TctB family|uniref:Tripartite tricarboxylate transporter TctB family protein n=1 Tax=Roseateles amylovorans TaxID=2978473 RepID=A0ABY6B2S5_9BURK|nr:tripartite tricarboxylate transporter TctB family protein [Roseateles amylovorans]UXH79696.1 tripartite tricarboxylate transporter TctB family protein [Roseateles amylovorans]